MVRSAKKMITVKPRYPRRSATFLDEFGELAAVHGAEQSRSPFVKMAERWELTLDTAIEVWSRTRRAIGALL